MRLVRRRHYKLGCYGLPIGSPNLHQTLMSSSCLDWNRRQARPADTAFHELATNSSERPPSFLHSHPWSRPRSSTSRLGPKDPGARADRGREGKRWAPISGLLRGTKELGWLSDGCAGGRTPASCVREATPDDHPESGLSDSFPILQRDASSAASASVTTRLLAITSFAMDSAVGSSSAWTSVSYSAVEGVASDVQTDCPDSVMLILVVVDSPGLIGGALGAHRPAARFAPGHVQRYE